MIGVPGKNRECAIHLLSQHDSRELMWQSHVPKRKKQVGTLACGSRPPISRPDAEHKPLGTLIANAAQMLGELL
jgi:hypothetical protein